MKKYYVNDDSDIFQMIKTLKAFLSLIVQQHLYASNLAKINFSLYPYEMFKSFPYF